MKNARFVAWGIILTLGIAIFTAFFEPRDDDAFYTLAGLGYFIFGIWAAVLLSRVAK